MIKGRKLILMPHGGCSDGGLGVAAFNKLGHDVWYSADTELLDYADLIILPGGADIDYTRYDGNPRLCGRPSVSLEKFDKEILPTALKREIPIFGICRGHQSLWVELGGRLIEDISGGHLGRYRHPVEGTWGIAEVNSLHHQAPRLPAPNGVEIHMQAPFDGTIEAFTYAGFAVAVQWHPEMLPPESWMHLVTAAINRETDRIPEIYGLKEIKE